MKKTFIKFEESGLFLMVIMLLCSIFGVADASAMTADAILPADGGAVRTGDAITATEARTDSVKLILDTIDERVTKIRPMGNPLDTISRNIPSRSSDSQIVRHYAIDTIDLSATLTTAIAAGATQAALVTSNNDIFASEQMILVNGVGGYMDDGVTADPSHDLQLYVVGKDTGGNPLVVAFNGTGATGSGIPDIAAGTVLTRMGRAGAETQIQTDAYSGVPTDWEQYLQKFMAQVEMSDIFQRADKEVDWQFSDAEEEAVYDMKRAINISLWKGRKARRKVKNAHIQKAEDVYVTEGIWSQAGKEFSFGGAPVDVKNMVTLMKMAFTGNASSKSKVMIAGSDVIEAFEQVDYNRTISVGQKLQKYGLEFDSIISKFGTLRVIHDESFDDMGMANKFFILDPAFVDKWTMGWRVNEFDFRKSGQSDSDGRGLMEICGLALRNPNAHMRGSLS